MEEPNRNPKETSRPPIRKRKVRKGTVAGACLLGLALLASLIITALPGGWKQVFSVFGVSDVSSAADRCPFSVHVLDVGKADAILVECEGSAMLIDGGTIDRGTDICRYLTRRGIKNLEYIVNTHPDKDHIGGVGQVVEKFSVNAFLSPSLSEELTPDNSVYRSAMETLKKENLVHRAVRAGETLRLGAADIQVLAPLSEGDSTNNNCVVLRITYGSSRFLFMGDAEEKEEAELLASGADLTADVLKVGHHGSDTSTTQELLDAVQPRLAVISVGEDSNNLPKKKILKRLEDAGSVIYRTDLDGTLLFASDGSNIDVITQRSAHNTSNRMKN